jgi:hypothetical protein
MFYTFIVLFEKSSTLIDLMDLCKYFISKRRNVTNLALTGWGRYTSSPPYKNSVLGICYYRNLLKVSFLEVPCYPHYCFELS